jgi:hypothetical protein
MESLLTMLTEATLTPEIIDKMIKSGTRVSLYYRGDNKNKKGWRQASVLRSQEQDGVKYLIVKDWGSGNEEEVVLLQSEISNWNILSTVKKDLDNEIRDAIANKRKVVLRYKGAEESSVGDRIGVCPVVFGVNKYNRKVIRAWVDVGSVSISAQKRPNSPKRQLAGWRLFRMDRLSGWEVSGTDTFPAPPGGGIKGDYEEGSDKGMKKIIAYAKFPTSNKNKSKKELPKDLPTLSKPVEKKPKKSPSPTAPEKTTPPENVKKKPIKGPARPGAPKKPDEPEDKEIKESKIMEAILEAVRIL